MRRYLHTVVHGSDEFETRNAFLVAHHPDIFRVFAVTHTKAIGLTLCQTLLCATTVDIVQPDTPWNGEKEVKAGMNCSPTFLGYHGIEVGNPTQSLILWSFAKH